MKSEISEEEKVGVDMDKLRDQLYSIKKARKHKKSKEIDVMIYGNSPEDAREKYEKILNRFLKSQRKESNKEIIKKLNENYQ